MNAETDAVPPLKLGDAPPLPAKVRERLRGRVTAGDWLAGGVDPELDAARARHHELLKLAAAALDALRAERRSWEVQDREHAAKLREAVRAGKREPDDERPTGAERKATEARLVERVQAALAVLAEFVGHAVEVVREAEDRILAGLKGQAADAREQRRQAEELLAEARRREWQLVRLARWTLTCANDAGGFGPQPAPDGAEDPPAAFQGLRDSQLERPWHRPVNAAEEVEELARGLRAEPDDDGDPTGTVSGIVEVAA